MTGPCQVHKTHAPAPLVIHVHHILPLAMLGPDTAANRIRVCPTGHANIHHMIHLLIKGEPLVGSRFERRVAREGYEQWVAAGKPGRPE